MLITVSLLSFYHRRKCVINTKLAMGIEFTVLLRNIIIVAFLFPNAYNYVNCVCEAYL